MKILTFNTWQERGPWRKRWEITFEGIKEIRPDVIAFQEVFNPEWAQEIKKRTGFPHLVFAKEHSGLMFLSRFPVADWACLTMKTKSPTEDYLRYALFADLQIGAAHLPVFNTHLSWRTDEGKIREQQVDELLDFMDEKAPGREAAVMGDFNAPPDTPEIRKMKQRGKFVDTFALLDPKDPGLTWNNQNPYANGSSVLMPDRRIDYIFIRNQKTFLSRPESAKLVLTDPDSDGIFASDHFGVLAAFS